MFFSIFGHCRYLFFKFDPPASVAVEGVLNKCSGIINPEWITLESPPFCSPHAALHAACPPLALSPRLSLLRIVFFRFAKIYTLFPLRAGIKPLIFHLSSLP